MKSRYSKLLVRFGVLAVVIVLALAGMEKSLAAAQSLSQLSSNPVNQPRAAAADAVVFPDLTGPYKVGRAAYEFVDQSRDEIYASVPGLKRDLMVTIWFPAEPAKRAKIAAYMGDTLTWTVATKHPELENMVQARSFKTSVVASGQPNYPVIVFEPDSTISSFNYATITEELASQGYIVVGLSHPYNTIAVSYPDGRIIGENPIGAARPSSMDDMRVRAVLTADVHFVLDQLEQLNASDQSLKGHLDMSRVGIIGHNYGALIALLSATNDPRIKAGAALEMDPATQMVPPNKPYLYMGLGAAPRAEMQNKDTYWVYSNVMSIGNFGDFAWLQPQIAFPSSEKSLGDVAPARGIQITNSYLLPFFNHYLSGAVLTWPEFDETEYVAFPTD